MERHASHTGNPTSSSVDQFVDSVSLLPMPVTQEPDTSVSTDAISSGEHDVGPDTSDDEEIFVYEDRNLESIPQELANEILQNARLQKLSLKGNLLQQIPSDFGRLSNLYYLNLSHNSFKTVPECITELKRLEILDMSNNSLRALPKFLAELPHLIGLSLVANNFEIFPPIIADLPKLVILEIEDNPIQLPSNLPILEESRDEEDWLCRIRDCIRSNRVELENALLAMTSAMSEEATRIITERGRSASESNVSLRAAKRMGFVMSRNATDQSYVASLHARGYSHDANMYESSQSDSVSAATNAHNGPTTDISRHARSLSSLALTEPPELQPPPLRSPLSRSPYTSPWGSPRPSLTEAELQSNTNSRLSTLAEEHDVEMESGADSSGLATISKDTHSLQGDIGPRESRIPSFMHNFQETTAPEGPLQMTSPSESNGSNRSSSPSIVFKDSYNELSDKPSSTATPTSNLTAGDTSTLQNMGRSTSTSLSNMANSNNALESLNYTLEETTRMMTSISNALPSVIVGSLREVQDMVANNQTIKALTLFSSLLDGLTVPATFKQVMAKLSRRQQRSFATCIALVFPELESAWRQLQLSRLPPISMDASTQQSWAQDEQLHIRLDQATKGTQAVLVLLNKVVSRSAVAAADSSEPASGMAIRVRDLSAACIRCSSATRSVRQLLDRQAATHARTLQISERQRFWEEVNLFLNAVISILATVKAGLSELPLLADARVGTEVAKLSRVAKEIPPLLEQSSYRVLLDSNRASESRNLSSISANTAAFSDNAGPMSSQQFGQASVFPTFPSSSQALGPLQAPAPPTPLTASLGAAAQALVSPNERADRGDGYIQVGMLGVSEFYQ